MVRVSVYPAVVGTVHVVHPVAGNGSALGVGLGVTVGTGVLVGVGGSGVAVGGTGVCVGEGVLVAVGGTVVAVGVGMSEVLAVT